jgi:hypothetical protein
MQSASAVLSSVRLYNIFPHFHTNGKIFLKKLSNQLDITNNVYRHTRYSCHILGQLEFSREIFEKYPTVRLHKNPSSGSQLFHAERRTDRQTRRS